MRILIQVGDYEKIREKYSLITSILEKKIETISNVYILSRVGYSVSRLFPSLRNIIL